MNFLHQSTSRLSRWKSRGRRAQSHVKTFGYATKRWLNKPHRIFAAFMVLVMSGYGVSTALPANAAACATSGHFVILENCDLAVGSHTFTGTLTITGTVNAGDDTTPGLVTITAGNIIISSTGTLTTAGLGSDLGVGTGQGGDAADGGGGGGYGGKGGQSGYDDVGGSTHGTIAAPTALGSGGGNDGGTTGQGGGAVKLITTGTLTNNGTITSNGQAAVTNQTGGGSGGSVWIDAGTLAGSGTISSNGGRGAPAGSSSVGGGGGGGGRIAIFFDTDSSTWTNTAFGGDEGGTTSTATCGGAGTVYEKDNAISDGDLTVDNNDQTNCGTTTTSEGGIFAIYNLFLKNAAYFVIASGDTYNTISAFTGSGIVGPTLEVASGGTQDLPSSSLTFGGLDWKVDGSVSTLTDLTISSGTVYSSAGTFDAGCTSITVGDGGTFLQNDTGTFSCTTITVESGGNISHGTNTTAATYKLDLSTTTFDLQSGGTINLNSKGYKGGTCNLSGSGTGAGGRVAGGAHGGNGGDGNSEQGNATAYGNVKTPVTLGSGGGGQLGCGGGTGGYGGGAAKIVASGTLTINGTITTDGINGINTYGGGGAGGSVWLDANTLAGSGSISANGGNGANNTTSGGGGGGRISLNYNTDSSSVTTSAYGGANAVVDGGAGTIFTDDKNDANTNGDLLIANNNNDASDSTPQVVTASQTFDNVTIKEGTKYLIGSGETFTIASGGSLTGGGTQQSLITTESGGTFATPSASFTFNDVDVVNGGSVTTVTSLGVTDATFTNNGDVPLATALTLTTSTFNHNASGDFGSGLTSLTLSTGVMNDNGGDNINLSSYTVPSGSTYVLTDESYYPFIEAFTNLTVDGTFSSGRLATFYLNNLTVNNGGIFTQVQNQGSKISQIDISATGTITVNSTGAIDVEDKGYVGGTCNVVGSGTGGGPRSSGGAHGGNGNTSTYNNGSSIAYGLVDGPVTLGSGGGGQQGCGGGQGGNGGGAIKLVTASTLTIDGTVTADGGDGASTYDGGGAGGSVWIDVDTLAGSGTIIANGGIAGNNTVGGGGGGGRLSVNYNTDSSSVTTSAYGGNGKYDGGAGSIYTDDKNDANANGDLVISNNNNNTSDETPQVTTASQTYDNITINKGSNYVIGSGETLTTASGGAFTGTGTQQPLLTIESGGTFAPPSATFTFDDIDVTNAGDITVVTSLSVTDATFTNNGDIPSATALTVTTSTFTQNAVGDFSSDLASLTLSSSTFNDNGGGGLGFTTLSVPSGSTYVLTDENYYPFAEAFTNLTIDGTFISGRLAKFHLNNLTVNNGGVLTHKNNSGSKAYQIDMSATGTITVNSTGSVDVEDKGYVGGTCNVVGSGTGGGPKQAGGAYGGNGADGSTNYGDAIAYGSVKQPDDLGSGGGGQNGCGGGQGGNGGGAIKLVSASTLTIDGTVTADGGDGSATYTGGGAGGSVWVDADTLAGSGTIIANGGVSGNNTISGGGGGGRISVSYNTNSSSVTYSAYGGDGKFDGGAGSVYTDDKNDANTSGDLTISNNDNNASDATPQVTTTSQTYDNITVKSGSVYVIGSGETLTISSGGSMTGGGTIDGAITVENGGTLSVPNAAQTFTDLGINHYGEIGATGTTVSSISLAGSNYLVDGSTATFDGGTSSGITVKSGGTLTQAGTSLFTMGPLVVESGGNITHSNNTSTKANVLNIAAASVDVQSGGSINVDGLGYTTGTGAGSTGSRAGGGGYGGVGGNGSIVGAGGSTYGSATAPDEIGSAGGDYTGNGGQAGAKGAGAVKITVTGTMTINGDISANGAAADANNDGGGSGGSIWLVLDTWAGSTGTIKADGGNGLGSFTDGGGGGGGGRIYITYSTKTYSGTASTVAGGAKGGTGAATAGSTGTASEVLLSPTINSVGHSPASPTVTDSVTLTSSATYSSGLDRIEVYLDGTTAGDLKKTCDMASATSGNCNIVVGTLSGGSHTTTVKAYGDDATVTTDTDTFNVIVGTTANKGTVGRSKINSATTFALSFTLTNTLSSDLTVTFPASFTLTGAFTSGTCDSGTIHTFAFDNDAHTLTASKTSCTGAVNLSGANITLPGSAGLYTVSWENDDPGEVVIPVTDDDQVTVSANVTGEITFDLDIGTSNVNNAAPYTLAFGALDTASANGSNDSTVSGIWIDLSTNATAGAVVQVKSVNAALKSASVPGDTIASSSGTVNAGGTERYGLCIATTGNGTVTASAGTLQSVAPFTGSGLGCTTTNSTVGALTTSFQTFLNSNSLPIDGGRTQVRLKVDISDTTPAHDDYADTLTFRATATF